MSAIPTKPRASRPAKARRSRSLCPIQDILDDVHAHIRRDRSGEVASYIPELGKANPDWFGICLVTCDGQVYSVGDTGQSFTIQSISKPFVYGMALEDNGREEVLKKIWMEPSGEAFNAISLRPGTGQPENPMINAGAIATTAQVAGTTSRQKIRRILDGMGRCAGRELTIDEAVFRSESETGHRNRAIAHMLRNFNVIDGDPGPGLEAYFQQCSISVTCRDLGVMAATLANAGANPVTGARAVIREHVESILSVMSTCGMYDAAGEWIYNVGMPAKSGVAGGILAVLPGQLGIGVFSPGLDARGNSVRGLRVCHELSRRLRLHMFNAVCLSATVLRQVTHVGETLSNRLRSPVEVEAIKRFGGRVQVLRIQGTLAFAAIEVVIRKWMSQAEALDGMVLDMAHIQAIDKAACRLLAELAASLSRSGKFVLFSQTQHLPSLERAMRRKLPAKGRFFEDLDLALEEAENRVIALQGKRRRSSQRIRLEECDLLENIPKHGLEVLRPLMTPRTFRPGEQIIRAGDTSTEIYFLLRGKASVWIPAARGRLKRVATFSPGMTFGEMAFLDSLPRSASVTADSDLEVLALGLESYKSLAECHGDLQNLLLRNIALLLARRLRDVNADLGAI